MNDDPQTTWEPALDEPLEAPYEAGDHDQLPWIPTGDPRFAPEELGDVGHAS